MLPGFSGLCSDRIALRAHMRRSFERLTEAVGLKIRLNLLITAALVISAALGGVLAIHNYRRAVSRETEASAQLSRAQPSGNLSRGIQEPTHVLLS
jgi:hypothetical protein